MFRLGSVEQRLTCLASDGEVQRNCQRMTFHISPLRKEREFIALGLVFIFDCDLFLNTFRQSDWFGRAREVFIAGADWKFSFAHQIEQQSTLSCAPASIQGQFLNTQHCREFGKSSGCDSLCFVESSQRRETAGGHRKPSGFHFSSGKRNCVRNASSCRPIMKNDQMARSPPLLLPGLFQKQKPSKNKITRHQTNSG